MSWVVTTYRGIDCVLTEPDRGEAIQRSFHRVATVLDSRTGARTSRDWAGVPTVSHTYRWILPTRADVVAFRTWLTARRGQAVPCWVPTWTRDLPLLEAATAGAASIRVAQVGYTRHAWPSPARRHIAIMTPTIQLRAITAALDEGSAGESLSLDSALSTSVTPDAMVAHLTYCRLATDSPQILWHSAEVAECSLPIAEIPQEVSA